MMLGDATSGKSSLMRWVDRRFFIPNHMETIMVDYVKTEYYNEEDDEKV